MNHKPAINLFLFFLVTSISCSSGAGKNETPVKQLLKPGIVHEKVDGFTGNELSYALYLPSGCGDGNIKYPVILALDPSGSGLTPVNKYKDLAEKYGYILIGSNDSHNGQPTTEIGPVITGMLGEIRSVYPSDSNRIYLAGFSGGSRVAGMAATYYREVKGVIGCGAGFTAGNQPPVSKFDYFGIAGTADFNMNEMIRLDGILDRLGIRHFIATFPGPHAWPPVNVMEDGFHWITLNAMKDGTLARDDSLINRIMSGFNDRISSARDQNQMIAAAEACREAVSFSEGLMPADGFKQTLQSIEIHPEYKKQIAYRAKILKKESNEQQSLMNDLFSRDESWWKKRIEQMSSENMKRLNPEDTLMNARLRAFLSLMCYSNASQAIIQRNREAAKKVINIYELADPQNPEPNYMRAVILLQRYDTAAAVAQLEKAVNKGFSDKIRMIQQPEFVMLKNSQAWFNLLQKIK